MSTPLQAYPPIQVHFISYTADINLTNCTRLHPDTRERSNKGTAPTASTEAYDIVTIELPENRAVT